MHFIDGNEITGSLFGAYTTDQEKLQERLQVATPMTMPDVFNRIYKGGMPRVIYFAIFEYYAQFLPQTCFGFF